MQKQPHLHTSSPAMSLLHCVCAALAALVILTVVSVLYSQVLFLGWPLFSKTPGFRSCRQLHRFAWLVTSVALLVWHAVVFQVLLQQPASQWSGPLDLGTCSSQASLQV